MITDRDLAILGWIDQVQIADSGQIQRMFFNKREDNGEKLKNRRVVCNRILKKLVECKRLNNNKKERDNLNKKFYYYVNKPRQIEHGLLITEFIVRLHEYNKGEILKYEIQKKLDDIIPDVIVAYKTEKEFYGKKEGVKHFVFVEVHLSNNVINDVVKKYEDYYASGKWKDKFPKFPKVVILSTKNNKISTRLNVFQISFKAKDEEKISDRDMDMIFG